MGKSRRIPPAGVISRGATMSRASVVLQGRGGAARRNLDIDTAFAARTGRALAAAALTRARKGTTRAARTTRARGRLGGASIITPVTCFFSPAGFQRIQGIPRAADAPARVGVTPLHRDTHVPGIKRSRGSITKLRAPPPFRFVFPQFFSWDENGGGRRGGVVARNIS